MRGCRWLRTSDLGGSSRTWRICWWASIATCTTFNIPSAVTRTRSIAHGVCSGIYRVQSTVATTRFIIRKARSSLVLHRTLTSLQLLGFQSLLIVVWDCRSWNSGVRSCSVSILRVVLLFLCALPFLVLFLFLFLPHAIETRAAQRASFSTLIPAVLIKLAVFAFVGGFRVFF